MPIDTNLATRDYIILLVTGIPCSWLKNEANLAGRARDQAQV